MLLQIRSLSLLGWLNGSLYVRSSNFIIFTKRGRLTIIFRLIYGRGAVRSSLSILVHICQSDKVRNIKKQNETYRLYDILSLIQAGLKLSTTVFRRFLNLKYEF